MSRELALTDLIKITSAGVDIATFVEIRSALIRRYQEIYGSDIDLSTGSADGIFVNDLALIINNILQSVNTMYSNLDVNSASGVYLDSLCNLSNIFRRAATKSVANLVIKNISDANVSLASGSEFVDQSGMIWVYDASELTIFPDQSVSVKVSCSENGKISAPAGWIINAVEHLSLEVTQSEAAIVGEEIESDSELRARRNQSASANGLTVLQSLTAALLNIDGIEDVLVWNNPKSISEVLTDGSIVGAHSIYVILKQTKDIVISDEVIGSTIYEKLTPGVTTSPVVNQAEAKSYTYILSAVNSILIDLQQTVFWKAAIPINPEIVFKIKPTSFFDDSEVTVLADEVISYANALQINQQISKDDIISTLLNADPLFRGNRTYSISYDDLSIVNTANNLTFYRYSNVECDYVLDNEGKLTISIT